MTVSLQLADASTDPRPVRELPDRILDKISPEPMSGCWLWTSTLMHEGYGVISINGKQIRAHRLTYMLLRGPIPEHLQVDHLCRVRCCVNPAHMELVTLQVNSRRGLSYCHNSLKTHCPKGHEYSKENTKLNPPDKTHIIGSRLCLICRRRRDRERYIRDGKRGSK
jgi:hypothetical protein